MRFAVQVIVILVLASILELILPWWSIAIGAFAGGLVFRTRANFIAGFLGIGILWLTMALIIDTSAAAPLTTRVGNLFMGISPTVLLLATALIGGLVGGLAAVAGASLRKPKRKLKYY